LGLPTAVGRPQLHQLKLNGGLQLALLRVQDLGC
jgi:hypothetical protein